MIRNRISSVRLNRSLTIVSAIIYQAMVLQRWQVTIALIAFVSLILLYLNQLRSRSRQVLACLLCSAVALLIPVGASPVIGLIPTAIAALILNMVISLGVISAVKGTFSATCLFAWGIVGFSIGGHQGADAMVPLLSFAISILFFSALDSGLFKADKYLYFFYAVFLLAVAFVTTEFGNFTKAARLVIQDTLATYYDSNSGMGLTGIGRELFVGTRGELTVSQAPILDLSEPVTRLRANVFDRFDGSKWFTSQSFRDQANIRVTNDLNPIFTSQLHITWWEKPSDVIPAPAGTIAVLGGDVTLGGGGIYRSEQPQQQRRLIFDRTETHIQERIDIGSLLDVPLDLEKAYKSFGIEVVGGHHDAVSKSQALEKYFQDNYSYSLNVNFSGEQHPLLEMLHRGSRAYCVYFASAMALTLRTQGIPTRVVSGYLPAEENRITGRVTVRKRDAHAWVEIWSPEDQRFLVFDPTPMASRNQVLGIESSTSILMDGFKACWVFIRQAWIQAGGDPIQLMLNLFMSVFFELCIGLLLMLALRFLWGWFRLRLIGPSQREWVDKELFDIYTRFSKSLAKKGVSLQFHQPDAVAIEQLRIRGFYRSAELTEEFLLAYRQQRYGGMSASKGLLDLAKKIGED